MPLQGTRGLAENPRAAAAQVANYRKQQPRLLVVEPTYCPAQDIKPVKPWRRSGR
jgi:hypothetical protein